MLPTLATIIYFLISPINFDTKQIYLIVGFVFLLSYFLPLTLLILFKRIKLISDFDIRTTSERKIPLTIFIVICFIQGIVFFNILNLKLLSVIFFGSSIALFLAYLFLFLNFKTSLHLIGMSGFTTYFIILSQYFSTDFILFIAFLIFLMGLLTTARLIVKAHTPLELFAGFVFGSGSILITSQLFIK